MIGSLLVLENQPQDTASAISGGRDGEFAHNFRSFDFLQNDIFQHALPLWRVESFSMNDAYFAQVVPMTIRQKITNSGGSLIRCQSV